MCGKSFMTGLGIGMAAGAMLEAVMMPKKKGMIPWARAVLTA